MANTFLLPSFLPNGYRFCRKLDASGSGQPDADFMVEAVAQARHG
jgi:hypothetical protein